MVLVLPGSKKCYTCTHPSGASLGYHERKICGKGLIGKVVVEDEKSALVMDGYNCY